MSSDNNNNNNDNDDGGGKLPAEAMSKSAQDIAMKMLQDATFNMATTMMAQAAAAAPSIAPLQPPLQSAINTTAELAAVAQINPEATAVSVPQAQPVNNNTEAVNPTEVVGEEEKEEAVPSDENPDGTWNCTKCGFINPPAKTRCANDNAPNGRCLSWRGGKRSPAKWKVLPTQSIGDSKVDEGGGGHATRGRTSGNRKTYSDGKKAYQLDNDDDEETTNKHGTRGSGRKKTPSSKEKSKASASSTTSRPRSGSKTSASKTTSQSKSNKKPSPPNTNNKPPPPKEKGEPKPPDNPLLGDPKVIPAVHSIIHLLQTYGPLSYEQLKFNMVPQLVPPTISPTNEIKEIVPPKTLPPPKLGQLQAVEKEREAEKEKEKELKKKEVRLPKDKLQKVLDILYELGIIHIIDKSKLKQETDVDYASGGATLDDIEKNAESIATKKQPDSISSNSEYNPSAETFVKAFEDTNPIYCFGSGVPRMDSIMPSRILTEIKQTGEEVLRMKQRVEILKKTLMLVDKEGKEGVGDESAKATTTESTPVDAAAAPAETTMEVEQPTKQPPESKVTPEQHAVNTLKQLFQDHPEIVNDPVYAAALRMFRINVGNKIDHHKIYVDNGAEVAMITDKILLGGDNTGSKKKQGTASSNHESQRGLKRSASSDSAGGKRKRQRKKQVKQGRPAKPKQARKSNSSDSLKSAATKTAAATDRHNEEWGSGVI